MRIMLLVTPEDKQLILKPETEFEKEVCGLFEGLPNVYRGEFGECEARFFRNFGEADDLIIRFPNETSRGNP